MHTLKMDLVPLPAATHTGAAANMAADEQHSRQGHDKTSNTFHLFHRLPVRQFQFICEFLEMRRC